MNWSPDGRFIYANRIFVGFTDASVFRIDVASGQAGRTHAAPGTGADHRFVRFRPTAKPFSSLRIEKGGYHNAALLDIATKEKKWITDTQWEAFAGDFSPDGKDCDLCHQCRRPHHRIPLQHRQRKIHGRCRCRAGLTSPAGNPSSFSPDGKSLLLTHQDTRRPSDIWVYDLAAGKPRQLSYSAVAGLNPERSAGGAGCRTTRASTGK